MNSKEKGDAFEIKIEKLFKRLGKWNVKRNVILFDRFGNQSQIDLTFGLFRKTYVECKNYSDSVPLEMVAKFKEVLNLNRISTKRGLFITSSSFVPRATTIGIKTIDGKELESMEKQAHRKIWTRRLLFFGIISLITLEFVTETTSIRKTISTNPSFNEYMKEANNFAKQTKLNFEKQMQSFRKRIGIRKK
jgi:hypothetical protein